MQCENYTGIRKWFPVKTGVKQGSVPSMPLFIVYMETVIEDFKEGREDYHYAATLARGHFLIH